TVEIRTVGEEAIEQAAGRAVEHFHQRTAHPAVRSGNNVRPAITVHIASGHVHAAHEIRSISEEARQQGTIGAIEDADLRLATAVADDDVRAAITIHVAGGHVHAAEKCLLEAKEGTR